MATENPRVWFKSISLENVRSFGTKQTIDFTDKDGNAARWNVILGDNGTGKTTVLKGLCMAINQKYGDNSLTYDKEIFFSMRKGISSSVKFYTELEEKQGGNYKIKTANFASAIFPGILDGIEVEGIFDGIVGPITHINKGETPVNTPDSSRFDLFAYGAARRIGDTGITREVNSYISNLFDESGSLINAEEWLVQSDYLSLKDKKFANRSVAVRKLILKLFQDEISDLSFQIVTINRGQVPKVFFKTHYGDVRLHELSLGYKTIIAWMVDFAKGLLDLYPDSEDPLAEPAVCLVDEIDLHLHPKFQRTIIEFLTNTFRNTQFIVTAHSPLIVQSAGDANIIVLKREGDETVVETDRINVHDWRIDQILSSDMFGGIGGRAPDVEEKMKRRRALLRKDELTEAEKIEFATLEKELGNLPVSESREALKALDIIGQALINQ